MSDSLRRSLCGSVDGTILMGHMRELAPLGETLRHPG